MPREITNCLCGGPVEYWNILLLNRYDISHTTVHHIIDITCTVPLLITSLGVETNSID